MKCGRLIRDNWLPLSVLACLPVLVLLPSILDGMANYTGGLCLDGWSYVTVGQSLQRFPLGVHGWLPLETQYSALWGTVTRFISPAYLALLAPLAGPDNDTQAVVGQYFGWVLFVYASACLFFARASGLKGYPTWIFVVLACLSGWILKIENANNLDNALALCFIPAIFGTLAAVQQPTRAYGIVLGAMVATSLYAYPEAALFIIAVTLTAGMHSFLSAPQELKRAFGRMAASGLTTTIICVAPYAAGILGFIHYEITLGKQRIGLRPGEPFYHSLGAHKYFLPSFWGLTPDFDGRPFVAQDYYLKGYDSYSVVVSCALTVALLAGTVVLLRRKNWSLLLFVFGMFAAYCFALVHLRYPYAAYKVLVFTWFAIVYVVIVGAHTGLETIWRRRLGPLKYAGSVTGVALLVALVGSFFLQTRIFYDSLPFKSIARFKQISALQNIARGKPIALLVDETYANIWGIHFLRDSKLYLADEYRGYMVGFKPLLDDAEPVNPDDIRFVVTDNERSFAKNRLLAKLGPYYVWDWGHKPWAIVTQVNALGAVQNAETTQPFAIGSTYTEIQVLSRTSMRALITADFTPESGKPGVGPNRLHVAAANGFSEEYTIVPGPQSFEVPVEPGLNRVLIRVGNKDHLEMRVSHLTVSAPAAMIKNTQAAVLRATPVAE